MRKYIFLFLSITFSFALETVAIIDFEGIGVSESEARALTQRLTSEIISIGKFTVVERSEMKRLLDEQKFQYSGCVDVSCAVEIGKLLGAKSMIVGTISKLGETYSIDSRLIDVKTGENYVSCHYTSSNDLADLLIGMKDIAYSLCEMEIPGRLITKGKNYSSAISSINIISDPPGAEIYIDSKSFGVSPMLIDNLPPGFYDIHLNHNKYGSHRESIKLMVGEERQFTIQLKKLYNIITIKKLLFISKMDTIKNISAPRATGFYMEYFDSLGYQSKMPCSIVSGLVNMDGEKFRIDCDSGKITSSDSP